MLFYFDWLSDIHLSARFRLVLVSVSVALVVLPTDNIFERIPNYIEIFIAIVSTKSIRPQRHFAHAKYRCDRINTSGNMNKYIAFEFEIRWDFRWWDGRVVWVDECGQFCCDVIVDMCVNRDISHENKQIHRREVSQRQPQNKCFVYTFAVDLGIRNFETTQVAVFGVSNCLFCTHCQIKWYPF